MAFGFLAPARQAYVKRIYFCRMPVYTRRHFKGVDQGSRKRRNVLSRQEKQFLREEKMRKSFLCLLAALCFASFVTLGSATRELAQEGQMKNHPAKEARIEGVIVRSNDKTSTLTLRTSKEKVERIVHFNASTRWTQGAKEGVKDIDRGQVKDGDRVICLGNFDAKKEFVATRIDKRLPGAGTFHER